MKNLDIRDDWKDSEEPLARVARLQKIMRDVCHAAGVTKKELAGESSCELLSDARKVLCYHAVEEDGFTQYELADVLNRARCTISHLKKKFVDLILYDKRLQALNNKYLQVKNLHEYAKTI
jgi:chromosomal replication initiation ATPase DnaA